MDIQAYIQSGIIESYVLGMTSAEETAEVEQLRARHQEVEAAILEFSVALEENAFENAVAPPPALKSRILAAIKNETAAIEPGPQTMSFEDRSSTQQVSQEEGLVIPIAKMRTWRIVAAASVILLVASAGLNYYLYNRYSDKNEAYQALLSERQALVGNNELYQAQLKEWQSAAAMMADTVMAMVKLKSTQKGKNDAATIFWNTQNKDVFVMVNRLPEPKTGKQYQLWAIVDGKPVDAGVLDPFCRSVCKMKNIPRASAFAITLEKEGGSPVPHLKAMYVMGTT